MKMRVKIYIHHGETIINQIAYQALKSSTTIEDLREFLRKTENCKDIDSLLRVILADYDIEVIK